LRAQRCELRLRFRVEVGLEVVVLERLARDV
jgi:hypothetical protein